MIKFKQKGDFKKVNSYFERLEEAIHVGFLDRFGKAGVDALSTATPVDSGRTASSWGYEIEHSKTSVRLSFYNTNIQNGVPIAIVLQYGHGTRNGGWVEGSDYINPALRPIFNQIANESWKEITKL